MAEKEPTIFCSRCGAEMSSKSRYCMKCGNLNYDHSANEKMRQYIKDGEQQTYQVGSGKFMVENHSDNVQLSVANNTGNNKLCFLINYLIYLLLLMISFLICCKGNYSIQNIVSSYFPFVTFLLSLFFLYLYAFELIFVKCNKRWWGALIPVYNCLILSEIVFNKRWLGLICIIPIIGQIFFMVLFYHLAKKFRYNGAIAVIFMIAYILIIGYGNHLFEGRQFVSDNEKNPLEKEYRRKRIFFYTCFLFLLVGIGLFAFLNQNKIKSGANNLQKHYYVMAGEKLVEAVEKKIEENKVACSGNRYSTDNGVYYFIFYDVGTVVSLPFSFFKEPMRGYVKIVNEGGNSSYYVSVSDGSYGYDDTLVDELTDEKVIDDYHLKYPQNLVSCKFTIYSNS